VSPVRYELGFYIPEDILQSHCRGNLKYCNPDICLEGLKETRGKSVIIAGVSAENRTQLPPVNS
jgi:hypothetical protein